MTAHGVLHGAKRHYVKHGMTRDPLYRLWINIKDRCSNPNNPYFRNYGGRRISLASEFRDDFTKFAEEIGPRPSTKHSIDRINNNLGYVPGNLRWATKKEQARNMRKNVILTHDGRSQALAAWAEEIGLVPSALWYRIFVARMSVADAVTRKRWQRVRA